MTVRVSKPTSNIREKLSELGNQFGLTGSQLASSQTVQEARSILKSGRKNLIINGNPIVYQRAQSASAIANYEYHTADRWRFSQSGTQTGRVTSMSVITDEDIAGDFIGNCVRFETTTAATSYATHASSGYNYRMEPKDITPYLGKVMTLSFYARTDAGIAFSSIFVSGTGISIQVVDPHDKSTWLYPTSEWKRYSYTVRLGTTVPATHLDIGIRHQPFILGSMYLTGIQFEEGPEATEFELRSYAEELPLCQRYYEKHEWVASQYIAASIQHNTTSSTTSRFIFPYLTRKRTTDPSFTASGTYLGYPPNESVTLTSGEDNDTAVRVNVSRTTSYAGGTGILILSSGAGNYFEIEDEL
jgi:hypothetical protein